VSGNTFTGEGSGLIYDTTIAGGLLAQNSLTGGASAWGVFSPRIAFLGDPTGRKFHQTFLPRDGYLLDMPFTDYSHDRTEKVLIDMTEDPLGLPPDVVVPILVRSTWYSYYSSRGVIGYDEVHVTWASVTLQDPSWPYLRDLTEDLIKRLGEDNNWWTDPGG
jgi:hypothetical protein